MTAKFTASNGVEIEITENGCYGVEIEITENGCLGTGGSIGYAFVGPKATKALREFFQHERDRELGRWHDPDNPDLVVYRMPERDNELGRAVRVLDETTGYGFNYCEHSSAGWVGKFAQMWETVKRYFEAHPETKPWDEAEPGEVWELTDSEGREQRWVWDEIDGWRSIHSDKVSHLVRREATAGRRIWPEKD